MLVKRVVEPLERLAAPAGEELVGQPLGRCELGGGNRRELPEHPPMVSSLPLAVLRRKGQLDLVLARARAAPHGLADRKEIERALVGLGREAFEPLRSGVGAPCRRAHDRNQRRGEQGSEWHHTKVSPSRGILHGGPCDAEIAGR